MQEVGRYQIDEMSGEGAMARVYKAYDPKIDRTLAIKALKSHLLADDEYRARFLREAKGAGILSHPNIVTVFDVGEEDRQPYIAMEWVDGRTLADLLKEGKAFTPRVIVEIGIQLARALDYAHKKGIVHRDVKPGNIMLVKDTHTVKVADFGICRINETEQTQKADQTQMGAVLGTPNYMSPEQVQGLAVDARSDLFSAGVVLYQMLTGHLPFEADSMISVVYKIANTDAPSLDKLRPDLPLALRRVIARALKKAPEKRYQTGEAMAQALIGVAREIDEEARRKGKGRHIPLSIRWALMMAALVAVTMSVTATILYQRQYAAMLDQATGYGGSLAKLVAVQMAVPLLSEDWAAIDVFIQETQSRQEFPYLLVVDHRSVIRGSNDAAQIGTTYKVPDATAMPTHDPGVTVKSYRLPDKRAVLDFDTPVLFQSKELGRVHLGLYEAPLKKIANLMLVLLAILTVVTSAAVAGGTYFLAHRLAAPIRVLRNSLKELASGHYDYRIADKRNDEFGELYSDFDKTADALEKRHEADVAAAQPKRN
ncbi:MAG TPA: protein kinase [Casimicrobiaceae bacterium]|nr:protein kinase [Casimicrobiaceae bacterium]